MNQCPMTPHPLHHSLKHPHQKAILLSLPVLSYLQSGNDPEHLRCQNAGNPLTMNWGLLAMYSDISTNYLALNSFTDTMEKSIGCSSTDAISAAPQSCLVNLITIPLLKSSLQKILCRLIHSNVHRLK